MRGTASTLVAGRYRLHRPLHTSPCTTLWRAVDEVLARPVAVKILDSPDAVPGCSSADEAVALFTGSATSAGRLAHQTIASTYDAGNDDGLPYIVTEWVEGRPLADLAPVDRPLPAGQATRLVLQVAEAVGYAHASEVAHGDLDASNVLVCADGAVKITDFAVGAALCDRSTPPALEGLSEELRDTRAVAALLYLLLTGRSVYGAEPAVPLAPQRDGRLLSPQQVRAGVPRDVGSVVMRALEPDSVRGTPLTTPDELAAALRPLAVDAAPDLPEVEPVRHAAERPPSRLLRTGVPILLLTIVGAGGYALTSALSSRSPRSAVDAARPATTTPAAATASRAAASRVRVAEVGDFDPLGRPDDENPQLAARAVDTDPATAWETERYESAPLGGLKSGVGLRFDLGRAVAVSEVRVTMLDPGARLELRAGEAVTRDVDGYRVVARAAEAGRSVVLRPAETATARYWVLWVTRLPGTTDGYRAKVADVAFYR
jgi:hypothetical protein